MVTDGPLATLPTPDLHRDAIASGGPAPPVATSQPSVLRVAIQASGPV
jgi:hypothetical protein